MLIFDHVNISFVNVLSMEATMRDLRNKDATFSKFLKALCRVDVAFQKSYCTSGTTDEQKFYFSGYHELYCISVKITVLSNGLAIYLL